MFMLITIFTDVFRTETAIMFPVMAKVTLDTEASGLRVTGSRLVTNETDVVRTIFFIMTQMMTLKVLGKRKSRLTRKRYGTSGIG